MICGQLFELNGQRIETFSWDWDLEAGGSDPTYAGEETYASRDSGYFDQLQTIYGPSRNQVESQGNDNLITYGRCGIPDQDLRYTNMSVYGSCSTSDQTEIYGNCSSSTRTEVYWHVGQSNSDGKNLELKAFDHRQTGNGYHTVSQRTKTPKANIDNS